MLRQRIITATLLLALLVPVLVIHDVRPFAMLTSAAIGAAGWEWARLNEAGRYAVPFGIILGVSCAAALLAGWVEVVPPTLWWVAMLSWVLGGTLVLRGGVAGWPRLPRGVRWVIGFVVLWTGWLALAGAKTAGFEFIVSVFAIVWAADVFAYAGGRTLGKRKLAPAISPGKSWEGVWSGMAGALLVAAVWLALDAHFAPAAPSFYTIIAQRFSVAGAALVVVFLVAISVVGDLAESLVKRAAGAKDSSGLLPGHGGILDRIDALLPVFPIALALAHA